MNYCTAVICGVALLFASCSQVNQEENTKMALENQVIQVTSYELIGTAESFTKAIKSLSKQTLENGPKGILRYSFYVNDEQKVAGATIIYQDPEAWIEQHEFVPALSEYQDFYTTIRLKGLTFFGNLSPEISQFLEDHNVTYEYGGQLAAGFHR